MPLDGHISQQANHIAMIVCGCGCCTGSPSDCEIHSKNVQLMSSVGDLLVDTLTDAVTFVCAALTGHFDVENVRYIATNAKVVLHHSEGTTVYHSS